MLKSPLTPCIMYIKISDRFCTSGVVEPSGDSTAQAEAHCTHVSETWGNECIFHHPPNCKHNRVLALCQLLRGAQMRVLEELEVAVGWQHKPMRKEVPGAGSKGHTTWGCAKAHSVPDELTGHSVLRTKRQCRDETGVRVGHAR